MNLAAHKCLCYVLYMPSNVESAMLEILKRIQSDVASVKVDVSDVTAVPPPAGVDVDVAVAFVDGVPQATQTVVPFTWPEQEVAPVQFEAGPL